MDIENLKRKLLIKYPRFGKELANVRYRETLEIETAATDGNEIIYNPQFMEKLDIDEQTFVLAHEVCHIACNHILRSEGRNHRLWNTATDGVINAWLSHDGLKLIDNCVNIPEAINMDAEELYEKLLKEKQQEDEQDKNQQDNKSSDNDSNEQAGHDSHDLWKETIERKNQEHNENKDNQNQAGSEEKDNSFQKENQSNDENNVSESDLFKENMDIKKEELKKLRDRLTGNDKQAGDNTSSNLFNIDNIGKTKQLIDWRRLLRESVRYNIDWSYRNADIENGVLVPHLEKTPYAETEILLDTSGSIDEELLRNFLRECKNILQVSKIKAGCFDTKFYGFTEIKNDKDIDNMQFYGRGGTDFDVAVNAFSQRVENRIIFTDGYADMPKKSVNAIWVVFGDEKINPSGGKVIYINEKDLYHFSTNDQSKSRH